MYSDLYIPLNWINKLVGTGPSWGWWSLISKLVQGVVCFLDFLWNQPPMIFPDERICFTGVAFVDLCGGEGVINLWCSFILAGGYYLRHFINRV